MISWQRRISSSVQKSRFDMKYSTGDTVKFRLKSGEVQEGEVIFIEKNRRGGVLYINGFNRLAYRVDEKKVISQS